MKSWLRLSLLVSFTASKLSLAAPIIVDFAPEWGSEGMQVTLSGSGLSTATKVEFESAVADFMVTTNGEVIAVVPAGVVSGRIRVTSPSGSGESPHDFRAPSRVEDFSPLRAAPGTTVTINGVNFSGATNIQFNGTDAAFVEIGPTQIGATVPSNANDGPIQVQTAVGSGLSTESFIVTGPGPVIDRFSQIYGAPGAEITLHGINFIDVTAVTFAGVGASYYLPAASDQLRVIVPSAPSGKVTVTTSSGSGTSTNDFIITPLPVTTNFIPAIGIAGTWVTIYGVNFSNLRWPVVTFNGIPVTGYNTSVPGQITVQVPGGSTTGPIAVYNDYGGVNSFSDFVVSSAPFIDYFQITNGNPGTEVRVFGRNLMSLTSVNFNGVVAGFTRIGDDQFITQVPAGAITGPIMVYNTSGSDTSKVNFVVTPPFPYITSITPSGGPRGTEVEIYGLNFGAAPTVRFNSIIDPDVIVVDQPFNMQRITAHVPGEFTTGPITVTTANGTSTNEVIFYAPPRLYEFTGTNGFVGDTVFIEGTNFIDAGQVTFGNADAPFEFAPGFLTATVPEQARSGLISVRTPGGLIISTNAFHVMPRITNAVPSLGATGTIVRILGTSFRGVTEVWFNGETATFTNNSLTEVTAVVPETASTGPIELQTPEGKAISAAPFLVVGPSDLVLRSIASAPVVQPGEDVSFTLMVTNGGPWTLTEVILSGQLPDHLGAINVQTDHGSCIVTNGQLQCDLGYLIKQSQVTITVSGQMQLEGYAKFTASITSGQDDLNPENNSAKAAILVAWDASRTLKIIPSSPSPGIVVSWQASTNAFQLHSTTNLISNSTWTPVEGIRREFDGRYLIVIPFDGATRFFRLSLPLPPPMP